MLSFWRCFVSTSRVMGSLEVQLPASSDSGHQVLTNVLGLVGLPKDQPASAIVCPQDRQRCRSPYSLSTMSRDTCPCRRYLKCSREPSGCAMCCDARPRHSLSNLAPDLSTFTTSSPTPLTPPGNLRWERLLSATHASLFATIRTSSSPRYDPYGQ